MKFGNVTANSAVGFWLLKDGSDFATQPNAVINLAIAAQQTYQVRIDDILTDDTAGQTYAFSIRSEDTAAGPAAKAATTDSIFMAVAFLRTRFFVMERADRGVVAMVALSTRRIACNIS